MIEKSAGGLLHHPLNQGACNPLPACLKCHRSWSFVDGGKIQNGVANLLCVGQWFVSPPELDKCVVLFFFSHRPKRFWNDWKKLSHFGQILWKYRLENNVMASFETTVRQITEMFQCPKCVSKMTKMCSEKKAGLVWTNLVVCFWCSSTTSWVYTYELQKRVILASLFEL